MTQLSDSQIAGYAANAGFRASSLAIAVAIALAESGGRTDLVGGPGGVGVWQISPRVHPQYSKAFLLNPQNNAYAAWSISNRGTRWTTWTMYNNGAYKRYLSRGQAVSGGVQQVTVSNIKNTHARWQPPYLKDMVTWISSPNTPMYIRRDHKAQNEGGVDLTSAGGTPVLALNDGIVLGAGTFTQPLNGQPGRGVVSQRINVPGYGTQDIYYQHIDISSGIKLNSKGDGSTNQLLKKGDVVGKVRADFGEVEVGFNAGWGGIWGVRHPGTWQDDPRPMLKALMDAGPPGTPATSTLDPNAPGVPGIGNTSNNPASSLITNITNTAAQGFTPLTQQVHDTLTATPGFYGIALALDEAEKFPGWIDLTTKTDVTLGTLGTIQVPDIIGEVRSVGATITDNFMPFLIRSGLVALGLTLLVALTLKAVSPVAAPALRIAGALA